MIHAFVEVESVVQTRQCLTVDLVEQSHLRGEEVEQCVRNDVNLCRRRYGYDHQLMESLRGEPQGSGGQRAAVAEHPRGGRRRAFVDGRLGLDRRVEDPCKCGLEKHGVPVTWPTADRYIKRICLDVVPWRT
jgi:hypothetical protein